MMRPVATVLLLGICALSRADSQARIEIAEGTKISLGKIPRGELVERTLSLKNTGSDTLHVRRVEASCGCTGTMISTRDIPPGTQGTLRISFNSKNFSGPVHKTVMINSDAADTPDLVVEFSAEVIDEVLLTPQQFWIKDGEVGRTSRLVLKVSNRGAAPLLLRSFRTTLEGFVLKLPGSPLAPGSEGEIVAEFTPKKAVPFLAEGVFVTTTNPHQGEIYIPIYGSVKEFKFD